MALNFIIPADESELVRTDLPDRIEITALSLVLDHTIVPQDRDLNIWADEVTIDGSILAHGRSIRIFGRQVKAINGAKIDVSGVDGLSFAPGNQASRGVNPSDTGAPGSSGASGGGGGNVTIVGDIFEGVLEIVSNGGNGGRGQDGGNGSPGARGSDGQSASANDNGAGEPGHQGGQGGNGGVAGISGNGGNGGIVTTAFRRTNGRFTTIYGAGQPGATASHGHSGVGGPGGTGGENTHCYMHQGPGHGQGGGEFWVCARNGRAPSGPQGASGLMPAEAPKAGQAGSAGNWDNNPTSFQELETIVPWAYGFLVLRAAEIAYLNADFLQAATLCRFLADLANAGLPGVNPGQRSAYLIAEFKTNQRDVLVPIAARTNVLLQQMLAGSDFFGCPPNFVTLVNFEFYKDQSKEIFKHLDAIKAAYDEYKKKDEDRLACIAQTTKTLQENVAITSQLSQLRDLRIQDKQKFEASIDELIADVEKQKGIIMVASDAFKQAVIAKTGNSCSFVDIIACVGTIVAVATGAGATVVAAISAARQVGGLLDQPPSWQNSKNVVEGLTAVEGDIQSVIAAYNRIKGLILPGRPEAQKLVMTEENVNELTKPYLDLPEARAFRETVAHYLDLVQEKNAKVLEYTQIISEIDHIQTQINEREVERARIQTEIAEVNAQNTGLHNLRAYAFQTYYEARNIVIRNLYFQHNALKYWSLIDQPFSLGSDALESLELADLQFQQQVTNAYESIGRNHQIFSGKTMLRSKEAPSAFRLFRETKRLTFTLGRNLPLFRPFRHLYVTRLRVWIHGVRLGQGESLVTVRLRHHGRSLFVSTREQEITFVHAPRVTTFQYDINDALPDQKRITADGDLGGGTGFDEVSPLAAWTIEVKQSDNPGVDISNVDEISLEFLGKFLSPIS